jgi:hypothetical protein
MRNEFGGHAVYEKKVWHGKQTIAHYFWVNGQSYV